MTRSYLIRTILTAVVAGCCVAASGQSLSVAGEPADAVYVCRRPAPDKRCFRSEAVEQTIDRISARLERFPKLRALFMNCYPNTLDTTVRYVQTPDGDDDTFVITGDIEAMWLRDSSAQVWPYVPLIRHDEPLRRLVRGLLLRQFRCIGIDPYANAFNDGPTGTGWQSDQTDMKPELHERKFEIDSLCYPLRLAFAYWQITGDASIFGADFQRAAALIVQTLREQQRKTSAGPYRFQRLTDRQLDTQQNNGYGHPAKPCGLIASPFRPSDDASTFLFNIPENFFAVAALRKLATIQRKACHRRAEAKEALALADEVEAALRQHAVVDHPTFGKIYAYEVDGFGNRLLMDDANVPSLLALPYIADVPADDPVYRHTRQFVLSSHNPYFFRGQAGEGIGGPHVGIGYIWPMSLIVRALTSDDKDEAEQCLRTLLDTDAGTGFMHETFHQDRPADYTRPWFAWCNTLFGELVLKLCDEGLIDQMASLY